MTQQQQHKEIVTRFNKEFIEQGKVAVFHELVSPACINRTAPEGQPNGADGMFYFLNEMLRKGFPDITVTILDQIAEGDKVTTRKQFTATHTADFMGMAPTGKKVAIDVIDIIRLENNQYAEHWGMTNMESVMAQLAAE